MSNARPLPAHYCAACHWPLACSNADCPTVAKPESPRPALGELARTDAELIAEFRRCCEEWGSMAFPRVPPAEPTMPGETLTPALVLDRADVDALLYALDDPDEFFTGGERADRMLAMWQRLHHARCYCDGEAGYHGDEASRSFAISASEAVDLWLLCSPAWLATVHHVTVRRRVTAILDRCYPLNTTRQPGAPARPHRDRPCLRHARCICTPSTGSRHACSASRVGGWQ